MWSIKNMIWLKKLWMAHNRKKPHVFPEASSPGSPVEESSTSQGQVPDARRTPWVTILSPALLLDLSRAISTWILPWAKTLKLHRKVDSLFPSHQTSVGLSVPSSYFDGPTYEKKCIPSSLSHLALFPKVVLGHTSDHSESLTDERWDA